MCGFPTTMRRALARVMATLKRLGLDKNPSMLCNSSFIAASFERTYNWKKQVHETKGNQMSTTPVVYSDVQKENASASQFV